jgi:hypothetical protein
MNLERLRASRLAAEAATAAALAREAEEANQRRATGYALGTRLAQEVFSWQQVVELVEMRSTAIPLPGPSCMYYIAHGLLPDAENWRRDQWTAFLDGVAEIHGAVLRG